MTLDDPIWSNLEGGYREKYDASIALKKLELVTDKIEISDIISELWNELHHQGDVGLVSYIALPQIIRIARQKDLFDANLLGLCIVIEQQRILGSNPPIPNEFEMYYQQGLDELYHYLLSYLKRDLDTSSFVYAIAALATCKGHTKLGKAIMEMSDTDTLNEVLEKL